MSSPISARMTCAALRADAGDFIEAFDRGQVVGVGHRPAPAGAMSGAASGSVARSALMSASMRLVSVAIWAVRRVDLVEQQPGQLGVVVVEAAVERRDQGRVLGLQPARARSASRCGSRSPAMRASSMSRTDRASNRRGHRRHLDQRVLKEFLQPLPVAGAFPGQVLRNRV